MVLEKDSVSNAEVLRKTKRKELFELKKKKDS